MAMALATYQVCQSPTENDSCGTCNACLKCQNGFILMCILLFPSLKRYIIRAETTSDDFIKEWREFLQKYPYGNISDWLQMLDAGTTQPNINVKECQEIVRN